MDQPGTVYYYKNNRYLHGYPYTDALGFFMDQMSATGPRRRQQNLIKSL
jgi:hypothetical protein